MIDTILRLKVDNRADRSNNRIASIMAKPDYQTKRKIGKSDCKRHRRYNSERRE